ncbi:hypothetical protein [Microbacterium sp.]|uniref:DUF7657 domain-containing protein n=1 Tax=Microbacterium sp. TaxID=51671 RepID=UPI0039E3BB22
MRARIEAVRTRWDRFVLPTAVGLPNARVVAFGLLLLLGVWAVLVLTSINGTSSGAFYPMVYAGEDPALLLGAPNLIRADEWSVQTVWAIAQNQQGLPLVNHTFPGGMDATIPQDLPRVDWTAIFRPHLWGFWIADVDHAQAWKWWLPLFGVAGAAYLFALVHLPARPITSMVLAAAFALSPFFQWWLLQTTLWPVAWGLAVLAGLGWMLKSRSRRAAGIWLALLCYLTVVMGMGIYVPFIIPIALVVACTAVGMVVSSARVQGWRFVLARSGAVLAAGASAGVVLVVWLVTRWDVVHGFLSTAYPGERLEATGSGSNVRAVAAVFGSSFTDALRHAGRFLDPNASESATFFLPGLFLAPVVVWLVWRCRRDRRALPWPLVLALASALVLLLFVFVPGWDPIAHLLLLDRTTLGRVRIGLGFASFAILVMVLAEVTGRSRPGWAVSSIGPAGFVVAQGVIALALFVGAPHLLAAAALWPVIAVVSAVVVLAAARGWPALAAGLLLVVSLAGSYGVNPLYLGVFDLRETEPSRLIQELDDTEGGAWVGIGDRLTSAMLLESGVEAFNGFQGTPSAQMWEAIDPQGRFEYEWNRLAAVTWSLGPGEPVVSNPFPDLIQVTFDPCSAFAQQNVAFVLTDSSQVPASGCLTELADFPLNRTDLTVWRVVPAQ